MSDMLSVALIGVGGYGGTYVSPLLSEGEAHGVRLIGGVEPFPDRAPRLADVMAKQIPVYLLIEALFAEHSPDLTILSTPIGLHAKQTVFAVERGSHVLCEKPIAGTPADAAAMAAARDAAGRHVAIGYQWSFSVAVQKLKADAMAGKFGKLKRMRTVVLWPRDEGYYQRNNWAGAIKGARGDWVLDSPVNNACAHHLHNMLYVAGDAVDRSATPLRLTAELYRANPIQNFDTAALRAELPGGAELLFYVTHAGQGGHGPTFVYEYEQATVESNNGPIIVTYKEGRRVDYDSPEGPIRNGKLWLTLDAIRGNTPSLCGIEAATPHCQCVWACQQSAERIKTFPADLIRVVGEPGRRATTVPGIDETLMTCYERGVLPSEAGVPWAVAGQTVAIAAMPNP